MRESRAILEDLAATGLSPAQQALIMELTGCIAAEARPVVDHAAENKRAYDREYQAERRKSRRNRTRSYDSHDTVSLNEDNLNPSGTDYPDEASASSPIRQPVTAGFEIWNENAAVAGWRVATRATASRQKAMSSRLREHGLDGWRAGIARARASPYLGGADPPTWFTIDWLLKAGNFQKLIEGNYDRRHSDNSDPTATAIARLHAFSGTVGAVG